jgi:glutamate-1-semialdehyde 2,1-aminomutase
MRSTAPRNARWAIRIETVAVSRYGCGRRSSLAACVSLLVDIVGAGVTGMSREKLRALRDRELQRFVELRPRGIRHLERAGASMPNGVPNAWMATLHEHPPIVVERGHGATFTDVDGNTYVDFNLADTSMFTGHGVELVVRAVAERVAAGSQFLLPTEDALAVALELGRRFGLAAWQFTLSATQANTEAIRVARAVTGRNAVVMFDGKYHGHADELLGELAGGRVLPEGLGVPPDATRHVRLVQYNDLEAVQGELDRGDVACVLAEAAVTNTGVIQPAEGFHAALRELVSDSGALLIIDETHTLVSGRGSLTRHWGLQPDVLVIGKSIASGIPLGAYGMSSAVAGVLEHDPTSSFGEDVATGGTLFGNALSLAAARVTLEQVLTDEVYEHAAALGAQLADGIDGARRDRWKGAVGRGRACVSDARPHACRARRRRARDRWLEARANVDFYRRRDGRIRSRGRVLCLSIGGWNVPPRFDLRYGLAGGDLHPRARGVAASRRPASRRAR